MKHISKEKEEEIIAFMNKNMKELEKWNKEVDELLKKSKEFFEELGIKREN